MAIACINSSQKSLTAQCRLLIFDISVRNRTKKYRNAKFYKNKIVKFRRENINEIQRQF